MNMTILRQFKAEGGCLSFILADPSSKEACLIDPRADETALYESFIEGSGLKLKLVIDTHTHADHYSGSHLVAERFGAHIGMSSKTGCARADLKLSDGQTLDIGHSIGIRVLETPGHTPDSLSLVATTEWGGVVFTGDTLLIGGSGRTDFPGADPAAQFESIHARLGALPEATFVLPAHDYSGHLFSTLKQEKRVNPHFLLKDPQEFVRLKNEEALDSGCVLQQIVNFNLSAKPSARPRAGAFTTCAAHASAEDSQTLQVEPSSLKRIIEARRAGFSVIDVSEREEFARGHLPGARNIPVGEILMHWRELQSAGELYFICPTGNRSLAAAQTFKRLGFERALNINGGFAAWAAKGYGIEK